MRAYPGILALVSEHFKPTKPVVCANNFESHCACTHVSLTWRCTVSDLSESRVLSFYLGEAPSKSGYRSCQRGRFLPPPHSPRLILRAVLETRVTDNWQAPNI